MIRRLSCIEGSLYHQNKPPETLSSAIWNTMLRNKMSTYLL